MKARIPTRRAFTLLEALVVIIVLAIAIPPTVAFLDQSAAQRADAINTQRATTLAQCVMESVLADVNSTSPGLGYAALADINTYVDSPTTGLRVRAADATDLYTDIGMSYSVTASAPVSSTGASTGNAATDLFRTVTVTVSFPSAQQSSPVSISMSALVTDL
ncbi:MAG TPA: prepilin-type N-terminal cleavage/methylation domain-containing protein [Phycisphaerales bacterium]|nr:prepilin-type N-terminal cleavage/methylation domain-containing protein [Phycisphaerales bacterium]